jgi:hypothetical protein
MGYRVNWRERNSGIPRLLADQRACPGIMLREDFGITLHLPYTLSFFADGAVQIKHQFGRHDERVLRYVPRQARGRIPTEDDQSRSRTFPVCNVELPAPAAHPIAQSLFLLGDLRLNSWIVNSGVWIPSLPEDHVFLVLPLPNHQYPSSYSVGQAFLTHPGELKIPIEFHLGSRPSVTIERETPMCQFLAARYPKVELQQESMPGIRGMDTAPRRGKLAIAPKWRLVLTAEKVSTLIDKVTHDDTSFELEISLTAPEIRMLAIALSEPNVNEAIAQFDSPTGERILDGLLSVGLIAVES